MNQGKCHICGKITNLTKEHIPPKKAINTGKFYLYSVEQILGSLKSDDLPWDFSNKKGKLFQGGIRYQTLCKECNNNTGRWYGESFIDFIKQGYIQISNKNYSSNSIVKINFGKIYPLRILKQIMAMFFSINNPKFSDNNQDLRQFVLSKELNKFPENKFKLYIYLSKGNLRRYIGNSAVIKNLGKPNAIIKSISELSVPPFGFVLDFKPIHNDINFCDITHFFKYNYNNHTNIELEMPVFEVNIMYPLDYRTKDEIRSEMKTVNT